MQQLASGHASPIRNFLIVLLSVGNLSQHRIVAQGQDYTLRHPLFRHSSHSFRNINWRKTQVAQMLGRSGLSEAVLYDDELFSIIGSWMSQGSLETLSVSSKIWFGRAYCVAVEAWTAIDMSLWPFRTTELRELQRLAGRREQRASHHASTDNL